MTEKNRDLESLLVEMSQTSEYVLHASFWCERRAEKASGCGWNLWLDGLPLKCLIEQASLQGHWVIVNSAYSVHILKSEYSIFFWHQEGWG